MDIPCLLMVPIRAPARNKAQHKPTAPLLYAKNNAEWEINNQFGT